MGHTHHSRTDADDALFLELTRNVKLRSCLKWVRTHLGDCLYPSALLQHRGLAAPRFKRSKQARDSQADSFWVPRLTLVTDLSGDWFCLTIFLLLVLALGVLPPAVSGVPSLECPSVSDLSASEILRERVSQSLLV